MKRMRSLSWVMAALLIPAISRAQDAAPAAPANPPTPAPEAPALKQESVAVGGRNAFDLIRLKADRFQFPLRYAHIIPGSETVELDGRPLKRDQDYALDAASGTLFLRIKFSPNQSLTVRYRYDHTKEQSGTFGVGGSDQANQFRLQFAPGTSVTMGLGYTERRADGSLISSNIFGFNNAFKFRGGTMNGVVMMGQRERSEATDLYGNSRRGGDVEEGTGVALIQNLDAGMMGGRLQVSYQDVDERFAGVAALAPSLGAEQANAVGKERGLKRKSFALRDINWDAFKWSMGYSRVGDADAGLTWRNAGFQLNGAKFAWSQQYVDPGFNRFNDLREQDRGQLARERGLDRQTLGIQTPWNGFKLNFDALRVDTRTGDGLHRQNLTLATPRFGLTFSEQRIEEGFTRFGDLRENERGQWARERGITRQNLGFRTDTFRLPIAYDARQIRSDRGDLKSVNASIQGRGWSFTHANRAADPGVGFFGSMTEDDIKHYVEGAVRMFDPGYNFRGEDRGGYWQTAGLERTGWRFSLDGKGQGLSLNQVVISNGSETLVENTLRAQAGKTQFSLRQQNASDGFNAGPRLLWSEQQRLGTAAGLDKTDFSFASEFAATKFNFDGMWARDGEGDITRQAFALDRPGLFLRYDRRAVDESFRSIGGMIDPERELLSSLHGTQSTEWNLRWQPLRNLNLTGRSMSLSDNPRDEDRLFREMGLTYGMGKWNFGFRRTEARTTSEDGIDIDQQIEEMTMAGDMGRRGKISLGLERGTFDGMEDTLVDALRTTMAYEGNLSRNTSFRTQHSLTTYEDGRRDTITANTLSHQISKRLGISVTDERVRRDGEAADETRRAYGFFLDFGKGIRLDYGYNRDMQGAGGRLQSETKVSGGEVGGVRFNGARYANVREDGRRDQHWGNVGFQNVNPFRLGDLKDIKFYYRSETVRDWTRWQMENLGGGIGWQYQGMAMGWDYSSQIAQNGFRAIDRTFRLDTDPTGKDTLRGQFKYGVRTMPNNDSVMVRDFKLDWRLNSRWTVSHSVVTNPLQQRNDVLLGGLPVDERRSNWQIKLANDKRTQFDLNWNEIRRDNPGERMRREARLNMTLFANNPSPLTLSYALQHWDRQQGRFQTHSFGFSFNQRPGPNQSFSFSVENFHYGAGRPGSRPLHDWNLRLDYSVRF